MADQSASKQYQIQDVSQFLGYNSTNDKTKLAYGFMVQGSQNVYKKISGNLAVRQGQKTYSPINTAQSPVSSEFVWNTSWGQTYPIIVADSKLQVLYDGTFYNLETGLTATRYVFDKWWDNTEKKDRLLFVNGNSYIQSWSGGIAYVSTTGTSTITKTVPATSWQQSGFSTTSGEKKIMINGTEYTYTGGEGTATLTGVTPDPSAIVSGTVAIQSVLSETNTPASGFNNDFIKVINNQAYVGSYTSRLCYISASDDYTDYSVPTPRAPGDPELITLDSTLNGIGVRTGDAYIAYGTGEWARIVFNDITVGTDLTQQTVVDIKPVTKNGSAYAHEFIANSGDNIVYLSKDQQLRALGDFNALFATGYPSLSLAVNSELYQENFEGGAVKCIGEFTYITAPVSGKVYLYQVRQAVSEAGAIIDERLWHSPFIWNLTRIDDINGQTYGFSNANPMIYQLWDTEQWYDDSPSGEQLPYTSIASFAYRNSGKKPLLVSFDKNYTEGYITNGTNLNVTINYDYQGSTNQIIAIVNSVMQPATIYGEQVGSLGDSILGDKPLGMELGTTPVTDLFKFFCINSLTQTNCLEYQVIYSSSEANSQWEIEATGTNASLVEEQQPTFLINKLSY